MSNKLIVKKNLDGTWSETDENPSGITMYLDVPYIEEMLKERGRKLNTSVAGMRENEFISGARYTDDGKIMVYIDYDNQDD